MYIYVDIMARMFAWKPGFNPRSTHTKYSLLNTQLYKVWIKGKVV